MAVFTLRTRKKTQHREPWIWKKIASWPLRIGFEWILKND